MSFFDEADEPLAEPRTEPRRRRPSGTGGRRPPGDHQAIMVRRIVAAVAIVIVLILIVVGVHSCQVSQRNSAMKDYANQFSALNLESTQNGANVFKTLSSGGGASAAPTMSTKLNELRVTADSQLQKAQSLSVPDEMKGAQQQFLLTMTQRRDGIQGIAQNIEQALGTTTSKDAINAIAANMARFYSSDVIYKEYASHQVVNALNNAGLTVGGANGVQIDSSQFLPDIAWLSPTAIARTLGASVPSSGGGHVAPGLHGHSLDSVSVGGTTLSTASTNTLPASPPATFTLSITNGGTNNETNVMCKVTVSGTKISGEHTIPMTTAGQSTTCQVTLNASPPPGNYTVTAEVVPVPGEHNTSNNSETLPVTFQ